MIPDRVRPVRPLAERFWEKVEKTETCWLWRAQITSSGYGALGRGRAVQGHIPAHRASWELHYGPIPEGLFVCHRCDVRHCVRPDHLFLGTALDNARDAREKGRTLTGDRNPTRRFPERQARGDRHPMRARPELRMRGEQNHAARLTTDNVGTIRAASRGGATQSEIAIRFGVSRSLIGLIVNRKRWSHV